MAKRVLNRVYAPVLAKAKPKGDREARMQLAVDLLWEYFSRPLPTATPSPTPDPSAAGSDAPPTERRGVISWVGFYVKAEGAEEMTLAVRRDKPACSPIGLHGVCGRSWRERAAVFVHDVATLGKDYIACDPHDKSELCVPLLNDDGTCWGVLDADSYQVGAFDERDVQGMTMLLQRLGLTSKAAGEGGIVKL
jgi:putative methionine-R-sulfoxide reductase with GAF domain